MFEGRGELTVFGTVTHTGGWDWNSRWLMTTRYLSRLREQYTGKVESNIDQWAVVNSFMIECSHMWDAFKNDSTLPHVGPQEVQDAMKGSSALRLCRDYANTYKHLVRTDPLNDVVAEIWEDGTTPTANFVTISYGPGSNPRAATIDALALAEDAYAAWQTFMKKHAIPEQTNMIEPLLKPATHEPRRD